MTKPIPDYDMDGPFQIGAKVKVEPVSGEQKHENSERGTKMKRKALLVAGLLFAATPVYSDTINERADSWESGVTYSAIAAGKKGSSFSRGYTTMESARVAAVAGCRETYETSCSVSSAERSNWHFVAGSCDGEPYTAASQRSIERAEALLIAKAAHDGRTICTIYARH